MGAPGKWKHGLKPAVPWWFKFEPCPYLSQMDLHRSMVQDSARSLELNPNGAGKGAVHSIGQVAGSMRRAQITGDTRKMIGEPLAFCGRLGTRLIATALVQKGFFDSGRRWEFFHVGVFKKLGTPPGTWLPFGFPFKPCKTGALILRSPHMNIKGYTLEVGKTSSARQREADVCTKPISPRTDLPQKAFLASKPNLCKLTGV